MKGTTVEPFLFSTSPRLVEGTCDCGRPRDHQVGAVVVDWERRGKAARQAEAVRRIGIGTQIGCDTVDDLARVRMAVKIPVICRINAVGTRTVHEVESAVRLGADEILVPMVRSVSDVELVLRLARDRVRVGIMIETADAVDRVVQLGRLPIARAYLGLMDLALDRGSRSIFAALADGTVERVRVQVRVPFGFGGLTLPGKGKPIPVRLLLGEMARLECGFSFLRRSFISDLAGRDPGPAVAAIREAAALAAGRSISEVESDHTDLVETARRLEDGAYVCDSP